MCIHVYIYIYIYLRIYIYICFVSYTYTKCIHPHKGGDAAEGLPPAPPAHRVGAQEASVIRSPQPQTPPRTPPRTKDHGFSVIYQL